MKASATLKTKNKGGETWGRSPQGLKPNSWRLVMSELELRPPKEKQMRRQEECGESRDKERLA